MILFSRLPWLLVSLALYPIDAICTPSFLASESGIVASDRDDLSSLGLSFGWKSDPFQKPPGQNSRPEPEKPGFTLQATLKEGRRPSAIINDRMVFVGDRIGDRILKKVEDDYVLLERSGSVIEVGLYDHDASSASRSPASRSVPEISIEEVIQ